MAAPFVDTAKITVRSGNGGNGVVSFHRRSMWPPAAPTEGTEAGVATWWWWPTTTCPP